MDWLIAIISIILVVTFWRIFLPLGLIAAAMLALFIFHDQKTRPTDTRKSDPIVHYSYPPVEKHEVVKPQLIKPEAITPEVVKPQIVKPQLVAESCPSGQYIYIYKDYDGNTVLAKKRVHGPEFGVTGYELVMKRCMKAS